MEAAHDVEHRDADLAGLPEALDEVVDSLGQALDL
jgi:hypothetical protein